MRHLTFLFFCALIVVCLTASCSVEEALADKFNEKNRVPEGDPLLKLVPDPMNPAHRAPLLCGACGAIAMELVEQLGPVIERHRLEAAREAAKGAAPRETVSEYETINAYDKVCDAVARQYGIFVLGPSNPTFFFSKDDPQSVLHGGWMVSFLSRACEDLMDEKEEALTKTIFTAARNGSEDIVVDVRRAVCTTWEASKNGCDKNGIPIDPRPKKPTDDL